MHSPAVAAALRDLGHDVVAVAEDPTLRAKTDLDLVTWAQTQHRRIVTENVKDFRRILLAATEAGAPAASVLFTSNRRFPRTRRNPGLLIGALDAWLRQPDVISRPQEDWLRAEP